MKKHDFSEYVVRRISPYNYDVAKFDGHTWPEKIYHLSYINGEFTSCTCPARENCKHMDIISEYIRMRQPPMNMFWIDEMGDVRGFVLNFTPLRREYEKINRNSGYRISDTQRLRELRESPRKAPLRDPVRRRKSRT